MNCVLLAETTKMGFVLLKYSKFTLRNTLCSVNINTHANTRMRTKFTSRVLSVKSNLPKDAMSNKF